MNNERKIFWNYCRSIIGKSLYLLDMLPLLVEIDYASLMFLLYLAPLFVPKHIFCECWFRVEYTLGLSNKPKLIDPHRAWSYDPGLINTLYSTTNLIKQRQVIHQSNGTLLNTNTYHALSQKLQWKQTKKIKHSLCPTGAYNQFGDINYRYRAIEI